MAQTRQQEGGEKSVKFPSLLSGVNASPLWLWEEQRQQLWSAVSDTSYFRVHNRTPSICQVEIFGGIEWQPLCLGDTDIAISLCCRQQSYHLQSVRMQILWPYPRPAECRSAL